MYIGKAAKLSGTTIKSIRHYEEIGLIPQAQREGKYRIYSQESVDVLRFIKCAQQLGFRLKELQEILRDYSGQEFPWELAQREVQRKKQELLTQISSMRKLYEGLVDFEENLKDAREECHLNNTAQAEEKNHSTLTT
ncbi:MerR family transcriptional regulator [Pseudomonas sp. RIT-PI-AD]|uniref:MerR family transcriptional regulator n=1 Tax=Pseudomonas sp. RIT-PI-AD TaxID=3035294 RepID=UPI0021D80B94|nr:MerR family transcriptional regulator [Pseudomonas sp. RIT-PI-AD]